MMENFGYNKDGYKLAGRVVFQGLVVDIEQKQGSVRYWTDNFTGAVGKTTMLYDYGYVRGTLGTDEDEVDVYLGPNPNSEAVYIINQMKTPNFTEFDEQKVMLGFDTPEDAKTAYINQYTDPRFFGGMKILTMTQFKASLERYHGEMLKSRLNLTRASGRIQGNMTQLIVNEVSSVDVNPTNLSPARAFALHKAGLAETFVTARPAFLEPVRGMGTDRVAPLHEPPVVPVRRIPSAYGV